jgi:hypothetical protein
VEQWHSTAQAECGPTWGRLLKTCDRYAILCGCEGDFRLNSLRAARPMQPQRIVLLERRKAEHRLLKCLIFRPLMSSIRVRIQVTFLQVS